MSQETVDWTDSSHQYNGNPRPATPQQPRRGCGLFAGVLVGGLLLLALVAVAGMGLRNGLIQKDEAVKAQWGDIDAQLQRRVDLIPNLVNTVKGYAKHEEDIFKAVSDARARMMSAGSAPAKAEAGAALDGALGRLLAVAESYPQLKANENFVRLQDELAGTENRIAVARTRYNETVKDFNASIRQFPGSLFVSGLQLKPADYFRPPAGSKAVQNPPEVKF